MEENVNQIELKRREIRIELKMLRVQRHRYREYLAELKSKVNERAKAKGKKVEREKEKQVRAEAYDDVMEILSHNCIKMIQERSIAVDVLNFAVNQLKRIRKSSGTVDGFIRESEAEVQEMRYLILKK